ncbi:MAG: helix-turn-helix transcriptional regulator [Hyphomicrobiales bacterium]|nr:helix-turn-helix transcriptional regulator [Hyphomicrobiales bacterium]MCP4997779.1 helix-turn-helix transcriptional regulator [Hyphomicrobiales bacterium]
MKSYGQFYPIVKAAELFCERWTALIIRDLAAGATRFSELHRGVPLMSPTLLSKRLKQLEAEGVVEKKRHGGGWTYHLTPAGVEFIPLVESLGMWGQRWSRREQVDNEKDLGLLLWSIERIARADAFGARRTAIRLELCDQPPAKKMWWFVNYDGKCQLCLHDPGFEVDIYLTCTLTDIIYVTRGDLPLNVALSTNRLEALGSLSLTKHLGAWFNLGPLTTIRSQTVEGQPGPVDRQTAGPHRAPSQ